MDIRLKGSISKESSADIALILEGTYPYIRGGVSSWVHQVITGMPEYTFTIIFLGDSRRTYSNYKYKLPKNVINLSEIFIMEIDNEKKPKAKKGNIGAFNDIRQMHKHFASTDLDFCNLFKSILNESYNKNFKYKDFLHSKEAWNYICETYEEKLPASSFLNYFWTLRSMHMPVFSLIDSMDKIPEAKVYHTLSTGYAGLLSSIIKLTKNKPVILTEHGIYTKERTIELSQANWIDESEKEFGLKFVDNIGYIRKLWIRFFQTIGRLTYETSDQIITLTEGNKNRQIKDGANPEKLQIISNGVNLDRFHAIKESRPNTPPPVVGFIGRVVPIKDVKTLIRASRIICNVIPEIEIWIIGGEEEDKKYAKECRDLVSSLELNDKILYKGYRDLTDVMHSLGLITLTSISEGLPLVILEAFASGRPVVATDVGACSELIEGSSEEDKKLGLAGAVTGIADSLALANEIIRFYQDSDYWNQACNVAIERVKKYYSENQLFNEYRKIYNNYLEKEWQE